MATFDKFDVCAAYNLYSQRWGWDKYTHGIQARLSRLEYRASGSEERLCGLSENSQEIYRDLVIKHQTTENGYTECACCGDVCMGTFVRGNHGPVNIGTELCLLCDEAGCERRECECCTCESEDSDGEAQCETCGCTDSEWCAACACHGEG